MSKKYKLEKKIKRNFISKTSLFEKLLSLRKDAIDKGMRLYNQDEVLKEVNNRRNR